MRSFSEQKKSRVKVKAPLVNYALGSAPAGEKRTKSRTERTTKMCESVAENMAKMKNINYLTAERVVVRCAFGWHFLLLPSFI